MSSSDGWPAPHTCALCQQLVLDKTDRAKAWRALLPSNYRQRALKVEDTGYENFLVVFPTTIRNVRSAAGRGCKLCQFLVKDDSNQLDKLLVTANIDKNKDTLEFRPIEYNPSTSPYWYPRLSLNYSDVLVKGDFQMTADPENVSAQEIHARPFELDPSLEQSLKLIRSWLSICQNTHKECSRENHTFMPRRVIKIKRGLDGLSLCLQSTSAERIEQYTALSYCWGGDQRVKLTSENLEKYVNGIFFQTLPPGIQDAITVTDALDICCLWIDSLCIVQDDAEDLASQICQMGSIYSQSTVTILASRIKSVEESFLEKRLYLTINGRTPVIPVPPARSTRFGYWRKQTRGQLSGPRLMHSSPYPISMRGKEQLLYF